MTRPPRARPGEINFPFMDRFTLVHFGIGTGYACLRLNLATAVALGIAWELAENPLKARFPFLFPHATADTLENSAGDTLAVALGWVLGRSFIAD